MPSQGHYSIRSRINRGERVLRKQMHNLDVWCCSMEAGTGKDSKGMSQFHVGWPQDLRKVTLAPPGLPR